MKKHGMKDTPEWRVWASLRGRCNSQTHKAYHNYGDRGITVCERWESFENFLEDMGERPSSKHSIDRIDNDGPYSPENCRWATRNEQNRNKRTNRLLTHGGKTLCLAAWAEELSINYMTLLGRLKFGWSVEQAITTPVQVQNHMLTLNGRTCCLARWARETGINYGALKSRLKRGWSVEKTLTTPVRSVKR